MLPMIFENIDSSAINTIKCEDSGVFVTFQSNIDKIYQYSTKDVENFAKSVENCINDPKSSIGRYINISTRDGTLNLVEIDK